MQLNSWQLPAILFFACENNEEKYPEKLAGEYLATNVVASIFFFISLILSSQHKMARAKVIVM